jgi:hypothetical protein
VSGENYPHLATETTNFLAILRKGNDVTFSALQAVTNLISMMNYARLCCKTASRIGRMLAHFDGRALPL